MQIPTNPAFNKKLDPGRGSQCRILHKEYETIIFDFCINFKRVNVLLIRKTINVADSDSESGAFLTPGSGIWDKKTRSRGGGDPG